MRATGITARITGWRERYLESSFLRDALTLMTGTTLAQIVPIAVSPLLTRIYSPADFGLFSVYMSVVSVLSAVVTGRYELAIMLPKEDDDAANVLGVATAFSVLVSAVLLLVFWVGNAPVTRYLGNPEVAPWLYAVPPMLLIMGSYQGLTYWSNRRHHYKRLAISDVTLKTSAEGSKLGLGVYPVAGNGLIVGSIAGQVAAGCVLGWQIYQEDGGKVRSLDWRRMWRMFKEYWRFPVYSSTYSLVGSFSNEFIILALSSFAYYETVGYLGLTRRFIMAPISFLSTSLGRVFFREAAGSFGEERLEKLTLNLMHRTAELATPAFIFLAVWAPDVFGHFFGGTWYEAGRFASVLMPVSLLFLFTSWPERIYEVAQKQQLSLAIQVFYDVVRICVVWAMLDAEATPFYCVAVYSAISCLYHLTYLVGLFHVAGFRMKGLAVVIAKIGLRVLLFGGALLALKLLRLSALAEFIAGGVLTGASYLVWYVAHFGARRRKA